MSETTNPNLLLQSEFIGDRWCIRCSSPPELYTFRGGYVGICSHCTAEAIGAYSGRVPYDLIPIEFAAVQAAAARQRKEATAPTVELTRFIAATNADG